MQWRSHFNAAFFGAWQRHGLTGPDGQARRYEAFHDGIEVAGLPVVSAREASGPLAGPILQDVYRFGVFVGCVVGRLLGLEPEEIERRADWCGRFNLGVSLFDYLSDEAGHGAAVTSWPPFDRLVPTGSQPVGAWEPPSAAAGLLSEVATDVLAEMENEAGPFGEDELWLSMAEMMEAETLLSQHRARVSPDVDALLEASRTKSSGPFRAIAEWMSLGSAKELRPEARELGVAIGDCYWLVDDARDLWVDLDAGRWNLFLLEVARREPELFSADVVGLAEIRLSRVLLTQGWVEGIADPVVAALHRKMWGMPEATACEDTSGLLAASIERWLN